MTEISVSVTPQELLPKVPEDNKVEAANGLFYRLKKATHESKIARKGERSKRSLDNRARRAELYKEIIDTQDPNRRKELLNDAHAWDNIEAQYLSQGEVIVDLPDLGTQTARYTMIEPPPEKRTVEENKKPRIFLIPGISNDLDSVGSLIKEVAFQGREVIAVGMPDSQMGNVTKEFARAVSESQTLEPHSGFFKAAINELAGKDEPFELWGFSTGSMIAAEILNDENYQNRVNNAVLLSPAGTAEMSTHSQNFGLAKEAVRIFKNPGKGAHYSLTMGRNELQTPKTKDEKENAGLSFKALREKLVNKFDPYKGMKVNEGGQITVVSGKKDNVTKSRDSDDEFRNHIQTQLISLPEGIHNTPLIESSIVVPEILKTQKLSEIRSELS